MNRIHFLATALALILATLAPAHAAPDQTYVWHGTLQSGDEAASGNHHFQLRLFAQPSGGSTLTPTPLSFLNVPVDAQGRFALDLSWDSLPLPTAGGWLEISLRPSSGGSYSVLSPRQYIGHVPYTRHAPMAGFAASVPNASIGSAQVNYNQVQLRVGNGCTASQAMYQILANSAALCRGYGSIGALSGTGGPGLLTQYVPANPGRWNVWLTAGSIGGQHLAANAVTTPKFKPAAVTRAKLADNSVGSAAINPAQIQRRITQSCLAANLAVRSVNEDGTVECNLSNLNGINGNVVADMSGLSPEDYAFVGGGRNNSAMPGAAMVGGGFGNENTYSGSIISGGYKNKGDHILGGFENQSEGSGFIVGGYRNCTGDGEWSFAAGHRAKVRPSNDAPDQYCNGEVNNAVNADFGVFIWADSQSADFVSDGSQQFLVRAAGGIHFGTNSTVSLTAGRFISTSTGAYLSTGGTWTNASSRAWKTPFQPIDTGAILDALRTLPMSTWEYIASPGEGRHLGPMAEDFSAAFGVGESTSISTTDASGVALAAIQGLAARSAEGFEALRAKLTAQNTALAGEIAELEAMLDALEQGTRR